VPSAGGGPAPLSPPAPRGLEQRHVVARRGRSAPGARISTSHRPPGRWLTHAGRRLAHQPVSQIVVADPNRAPVAVAVSEEPAAAIGTTDGADAAARNHRGGGRGEEILLLQFRFCRWSSRRTHTRAATLLCHPRSDQITGPASTPPGSLRLASAPHRRPVGGGSAGSLTRQLPTAPLDVRQAEKTRVRQDGQHVRQAPKHVRQMSDRAIFVSANARCPRTMTDIWPQSSWLCGAKSTCVRPLLPTKGKRGGEVGRWSWTRRADALWRPPSAQPQSLCPAIGVIDLGATTGPRPGSVQLSALIGPSR
jgi:hypothetical protein